MNTQYKRVQIVFLSVSLCCVIMAPIDSRADTPDTALPGSSISNLPSTGETKEESTIQNAPVTGLSRTTETVKHREGSEPAGSHISTTLPPNSSVRQSAPPNSPNPEPDSATTQSDETHTKNINPPHVFNQQQTIKQPAAQIQQFREAAKRFEVLIDFNGAAILDRKTGLVWERSPSTSNFIHTEAMAHCQNLTTGNRRGWALAHIQELQSLVDLTQSNPALPSGHPFKNVVSGKYQAYDMGFGGTFGGGTGYFYLDMSNGHTIGTGTNSSGTRGVGFLAWCVRNGRGGGPVAVPSAGKKSIGTPVSQ